MYHSSEKKVMIFDNTKMAFLVLQHSLSYNPMKVCITKLIRNVTLGFSCISVVELPYFNL